MAALRFPLLLSSLTVGMFLIIEVRHPYFFLQDDNRDGFLPHFVHNCRAVGQGEIPFFNFHQFLGTPALAGMHTAALYPPGYFAVFLSRLLFGHVFAAIEILALVHLVAAVLGFFRLTRWFGLDEAGGCLAAIAWGFCGYVAFLGNSWIWALEFAAYVPWILYFSLRQTAANDLRGFCILLALRVVAFFLGQPQFYLYLVFFEFATVFAFACLPANPCDVPEATPPATWSSGCRKLAGLAITWLANNILALLLAAPLLLPALHHISISDQRSKKFPFDYYSKFSNETLRWLNGLFFPFASFGSYNWSQQHILSHVGYLTIIAAVVALATVWHKRYRTRVAVVAALALFALLWANNTFITRCFYYLPYFNRFRYPFKLVFFASFYLVLLSAFGADYFVRVLKVLAVHRNPHCKQGADQRLSLVLRASIIAGVVALQAGNFLLLYAVLPEHSFGRHAGPVPFDEPDRLLFGEGRILSIGHGIGTDGSDWIHVPARLLGYEYATLFGLYHFAGYDMLLPQANAEATCGINYPSIIEFRPGLTIPIDHLRNWGVRWYVVDGSIPLASVPGLVRIRASADRCVLEDPQALPLVSFDGAGPQDAIAHSLSTNSITIRTIASAAKQVRIRVLYNTFFSATVDGRATPIDRAKDEQMLVQVPAGEHTLVVWYSDPYFFVGVALSGVSLAAFVALCFLRGTVSRSWRAST